MVVADWGDLVTAYHRPSGETHAFNQITAAFLRTLQDYGPERLDVVVKRVALIVGVDEGHVAAEDFLEIVSRLDELGLIERTQTGVCSA